MGQQIAMVTGASRGIGRATALALADHGYDVVITGRTLHEGDGRVNDIMVPGSLDKTAAEIAARGRRALPLAMDVTDRSSIRAAYEQAIASWGRIDALINNAPYSGPGTEAKILEIDLDVASRIVGTNYLNQLYLIQLALPAMVAQGGGTIVNLGSGSALTPPPAAAGEGGWSLAYCASKAAFHQVAVVVDVEYRSRNIRAFTIEPGYIVTEKAIAMNHGGTYQKFFAGDPPEVGGNAVAFLVYSADADKFLGKMVHAQALCRKYDLVPGWPRS
jgi:NAD(P)-dependent dehydrogenase (short-subunit alcohol dehydrogenase family)